MNNPLLQLTLARVREFIRQPAAIFWVYGFPIILAGILGTAFQNRPVEKVRVDIAESSADAESRLQSLTQEPRLDVRIVGDAEARNRLRTAKTDLVYFAAAAIKDDVYLLDQNRAESVLARNAVENARLKGSALTAKEETMNEPGSRYIDFLFPGLLGLNLLGGGLFGVGFVVVDMRVRKLLKRFLATPMRKRDFLFSLMLSRLLFSVIEMFLLMMFAYLAFDIHIRGNFAAFCVLLLAGGLCFTGLGLLIGCRSKTIEAVSGMMNAIMIPMYLFCGVFFSSDRFPDYLQPFIKALPLTQLNAGLRAVMNDGAGLEAVIVPLVILIAWGVAAFAVALRCFRWR